MFNTTVRGPNKAGQKYVIILTTWKETRSAKWTVVGALMPLGIAFAVCFLVANLWRLLAG